MDEAQTYQVTWPRGDVNHLTAHEMTRLPLDLRGWGRFFRMIHEGRPFAAMNFHPPGEKAITLQVSRKE